MRNNNLLNICSTATITALMIGGKWALASLPNIEIVSLLLAVYATIWGRWAILASMVFVTIESMLWGFGTWVIHYAIYWPLLATTFATLRKILYRQRPAKQIVTATIASVLLTLVFGLITSMIDVLIGYDGSSMFFLWDNLLYRFGIMYVRGIWYYVIHIVSNGVLFALCYHPLVKALSRMQDRLALHA